MSHTFTHLCFHIVFSTKMREPHLHNGIRPKLFSYFGGVARAIEAQLIEAGGVEDHVHLLVAMPPKLALSNVAMKLKANSSRWLKTDCGLSERFAWQEGFSAFTVSRSMEKRVRHYIRNQEEHHRVRTYQEEMTILERACS